jgi:hypothetical protein
VVVSRRDWEFLWEQLKSTTAVAQYLNRIAGREHVLGEESLRYYDLAQDDLDASADPTSVEIIGRTAHASKVPLLPLAPAGANERQQHLLFRSILEDVATAAVSSSSEEDRLTMLAALDSIPVASREELGGFLFRAMRAVLDEATPKGAAWRFRTILAPRPPAPPDLHLGFAACSRTHSDMIVDLFQWWLELRRHDLLEPSGAKSAVPTVGILLTPDSKTRNGWDTTVLSAVEWPERTEEEFATIREAFPLNSIA